MVDAGTLGAIAAVAVPLLGFLYRVDRRAGKAVRLLTGEEEVEDDGVLPRLRDVEEQTERHESVLAREGALRADGGSEVTDDSEDDHDDAQALVTRLLALLGLQGMDAPTEDASERDGFLSYAGEIHASIAGGGAGVAAALLGRPELLGLVIAVALGVQGVGKLQGRHVGHELRREPWYGIGAALIGYLAAGGSAALGL